MKYAHFLKGLKIRYVFLFLLAWSDNKRSVNKNKEKYRKIVNNFLLLWDWISLGSSTIF